MTKKKPVNKIVDRLSEKRAWRCPTVVLFLCAYVGFIVSIYPYVIPFQTTIWQAAAPDSSLRFLLFGVIIMLPILLIYTGYSYHIFKGKVKNVFEY